MKLVEIKDIRPGQIWEAHRNQFLILSRGNNIIVRMYERGNPVAEGIKSADEFIDMRLWGKFGITHRIEGNKLVEIPRSAGFQTDDVVKFKWDPRLYVINREIDFGIKETHPNNSCFEATNDLYGSRQLVDFELKRVGILGVTHEFVNDKEAR